MAKGVWVSALVRRKLLDEPTFSRQDEDRLLAALSEIQRIRANVVFLTRLVTQTSAAALSSSLTVEALHAFRTALLGHMAAIRQAFIGNLEHFRTPDEAPASDV